MLSHAQATLILNMLTHLPTIWELGGRDALAKLPGRSKKAGKDEPELKVIIRKDGGYIILDVVQPQPFQGTIVLCPESSCYDMFQEALETSWKRREEALNRSQAERSEAQYKEAKANFEKLRDLV